jgi:toxin ParE1/3/4
MKIIWLKTAVSDLDALTDYIAEENPQSALQVNKTIQTGIEKLVRYPSAGREGRVERTRELVIPQLPFIVIYTIAKEVKILAILHTSRKWPPMSKWKR